MKSTDELWEEISGSESVDRFLTQNETSIDKESFSQYIQRLAVKAGLNKREVIKRSQVNEIYGYQIFSGVRVPSQDKIIALALAMELDLEETQKLLRLAGAPMLYPKFGRDCIIIMAINNHNTVVELNEQLFSHDMDCLK